MEKRSFQVLGETLGAIELFADLDLPARSAIAELCRGQRFEAGEVVLSAREETTDVFFIISGELRITVYSSGGKQVTFNDKEAGSTFGELAAIDGRPRSAHVIAVSDAALAQ
ncbi:MAG: cyclic nucleotide-binding domain-containing protein, partial [Gammaproteobacteria bacterium]|nr:cyclic nucleotide-binding domain-containing protein [Gammaproteobacteria bacterium]